MSDWNLELTTRIATAVRSLREVGDISAQGLSDRTAELGHRVTRALIADLETGRRKYVSVSELVMLSAALGVSPGVLVTWDLIPDGDVEVIPGRTVSGLEALEWWGGKPLNPFSTAALGLPRDNPRIADLVEASRERSRLHTLLIKSRIGGIGDFDPAIVPTVRERLQGVLQRIRDLGGVLRTEDTKGEG